MIGRLQGKLIYKQPPQLMLDVNGVGYEIYAPMTTFYQLPPLNEMTTLLTHLVIREDAHILYGFHDEKDRELFRALIKVNGVGPKLALSILSGIEVGEFITCVQHNDATRLTRIPGVGKKTAERLVIETRDTVSHWQDAKPLEAKRATPSQQFEQDAISALTALGYKPAQAKRAIETVSSPELTSEQLIRQALKQMLQGV